MKSFQGYLSKMDSFHDIRAAEITHLSIAKRHNFDQIRDIYPEFGLAECSHFCLRSADGRRVDLPITITRIILLIDSSRLNIQVAFTVHGGTHFIDVNLRKFNPRIAIEPQPEVLFRQSAGADKGFFPPQ